MGFPKQVTVGLSRSEALILAICIVLSVAVHAVYVLDGLGEPDAARLAVHSIVWQRTGSMEFLSYTPRTSPLYLHTLKTFLTLGFPIRWLPQLMNWINVILGSLTLLPMYLLWRRLASPRAAAGGCLLFWFTPAFWQANIYGMPHLPSFFLFLVSLLLFVTALPHSGRRFLLLVLAAAVLASASLGFKADTVLSFGAFFGMIFCLRSFSRRNVALSLIIPLIAVIAVVTHTRLIVPTLPPVNEFAMTWSERWPLTIQTLAARQHTIVPMSAVGKFFFFAIMFSIIYCAIRRKFRRVLFLSLIWALPGILFWSLRIPNSARHLMASYSILTFLAATTMMSFGTRARFGWMVVLVLIALNYFRGPDWGTVDSPISRLHDSRIMIERVTRIRHRAGEVFVAKPDKKKVYIGSSTVPYVQWKIFAAADRFEIVSQRPFFVRVTHADGSTRLVRVRYGQRGNTVRPMGDWKFYSSEWGLKMSPSSAAPRLKRP